MDRAIKVGSMVTAAALVVVLGGCEQSKQVAEDLQDKANDAIERGTDAVDAAKERMEEATQAIDKTKEALASAAEKAEALKERAAAMAGDLSDGVTEKMEALREE